MGLLGKLKAEPVELLDQITVPRLNPSKTSLGSPSSHRGTHLPVNSQCCQWINAGKQALDFLIDTERLHSEEVKVEGVKNIKAHKKLLKEKEGGATK